MTVPCAFVALSVYCVVCVGVTTMLVPLTVPGAGAIEIDVALATDHVSVALEPHVNFWHVQDLILVRQGAPLLLSPKFNTDQPFIAG